MMLITVKQIHVFFHFDCIAGELIVDESHLVITHNNTYFSVYHNVKRNYCRIFYARQIHMMEILKLYVIVCRQTLTYINQCVRYEMIIRIEKVKLAQTLRRT